MFVNYSVFVVVYEWTCVRVCIICAMSMSMSLDCFDKTLKIVCIVFAEWDPSAASTCGKRMQNYGRALSKCVARKNCADVTLSSQKVAIHQITRSISICDVSFLSSSFLVFLFLSSQSAHFRSCSARPKVVCFVAQMPMCVRLCLKIMTILQLQSWLHISCVHIACVQIPFIIHKSKSQTITITSIEWHSCSHTLYACIITRSTLLHWPIYL